MRELFSRQHNFTLFDFTPITSYNSKLDTTKITNLVTIIKQSAESISCPSNMSGAHTPLAVYELLEMTLEYLSFEDLQNARLVSHSWDGMITNSKRLQRNLFFEPRQPERLVVFEDDGSVAFRALDAPDASSGNIIAVGHPRLVRKSPNEELGLALQHRAMQIQLDLMTLGRLLSGPANAKFLQSFLTQPPCKTVRIIWDSGRTQGFTILEDPNGVRLATIRSQLKGSTPDQAHFTRYGGHTDWSSRKLTGRARGFVAEDSIWVQSAENNAASAKLLEEQRKRERMLEEEGQAENTEEPEPRTKKRGLNIAKRELRALGILCE